MEATSERSFMSALNERECARSSEWQRLNGAHPPLLRFIKVTCSSQHVCSEPGNI